MRGDRCAFDEEIATRTREYPLRMHYANIDISSTVLYDTKYALTARHAEDNAAEYDFVTGAISC